MTPPRRSASQGGFEAPLLVGIAGGSGSGKTALSRALVTALGRERVAFLAHDGYHRDRSALSPAERASLDENAPAALDQALFLTHLRALRAGTAIQPPRYSFTTHRRTGFGAPVIPRPVTLVEGALLLCDPAVRAVLDLSIYLDAPERIRLERRLARDLAERRGAAASGLAQFQATLRRVHAAWVEPSRERADLVLSTVGPIAPLAEIAAVVILDRLARRAEFRTGVA